ncbi:hypothetical protein AGMMS50218_01180 [Actinomycetota bacterium]|nr:hypothetical protein AGMMS50218_01180 [Actinomycetota bacterium]
MQIRPGVPVLCRGADEVQLGTDPRWAVRLDGLTPADVDLLLGLRDEAAVPVEVRAERAGVPVDRAAELSAALSTAGMLVETTATRQSAIAPALSGDVAVSTLLSMEGDGRATVRARAQRSVGVVGLDRIGLTVAATLAGSGVGTVLLADPAPVTRQDAGAAGYRTSDVGSPRLSAAARVLHDVAPTVHTDRASDRPPDVVVLVHRGAADSAAGVALVSADLPHLSVVSREADAFVGPFVRPGASVCLRCLDLHRRDLDPAWPLLVPQLLPPDAGPPPRWSQLTGTRHPGRRPAHRAGIPAALAGVCGALAAAQVLAHLDGAIPGATDAAYEISAPDVTPRRRAWQVHPECGCTRLPPSGARGGRAPDGGRGAGRSAAAGSSGTAGGRATAVARRQVTDRRNGR